MENKRTLGGYIWRAATASALSLALLPGMAFAADGTTQDAAGNSQAQAGNVVALNDPAAGLLAKIEAYGDKQGLSAGSSQIAAASSKAAQATQASEAAKASATGASGTSGASAKANKATTKAATKGAAKKASQSADASAATDTSSTSASAKASSKKAEKKAAKDAKTAKASADAKNTKASKNAKGAKDAKASKSKKAKASKVDKASKLLEYDRSLIEQIGTQEQTGHTICCPSFSCAYADAVMDGTVHDHDYYTCSWCTWTDWGGSASVDRCVGTDEELLREAYDQISKGKPTVIHVAASYGEHWIALIGYENATDPDHLTLSNFIALDPWDASQINAGDNFVLYGDGCEHISDR